MNTNNIFENSPSIPKSSAKVPAPNIPAPIPEVVAPPTPTPTPKPLVQEQRQDVNYPPSQLIDKVSELKDILQGEIEKFCNAEAKNYSGQFSKEQATVVASDIFYKYLTYELKQMHREALDALPEGTHWQDTGGTVYMKEKATTLHLNLAEYGNKLSRTIREGEDRKGYNCLSNKKAQELGYKN